MLVGLLVERRPRRAATFASRLALDVAIERSAFVTPPLWMLFCFCCCCCWWIISSNLMEKRNQPEKRQSNHSKHANESPLRLRRKGMRSRNKHSTCTQSINSQMCHALGCVSFETNKRTSYSPSDISTAGGGPATPILKPAPAPNKVMVKNTARQYNYQGIGRLRV